MSTAEGVPAPLLGWNARKLLETARKAVTE